MNLINITPEYLTSQGLSPTFPERFWNKVNKNGPSPPHRPELGPCWIWVGGLTGAYGCIGLGVRRGDTIRAQRASWLLHFGPIAKGFCILHHCDHPPCVNPAHLFLGTRADNNRDCSRKNRKSFGEKNPNHKLSEQQVVEIRSRFASGQTSVLAMTKLFGVSDTTIYKILNGQKWRHL